ncbi:MAG: SurA N-terminal domain-containing protein [Verrucomicrobia bacterium]|nr:SurA N-terminal domain-containing protein [Verrucomicrobiota bacterium]
MKVAFILAVAFFVSGQALRSEQLLNRVVARVNDAVITYRDVQNRVAQDIEFLQRQYRTQPDVLNQRIDALVRTNIEELVEEQLILHEFKTAGYNLPESYIDDEIDKDIRSTYTDRATLTKSLQAQGLTYEAYRTKLRERFILRAMWQHNVPRDPLVSPHKIELYWIQNRDKFRVEDEVKLRMIVLTNRPNDRLYSPKKLSREILSKIKEGAPFAEMARIYSQGSQSNEGGDWNWVQRSVLRQDLAQIAFTLKPGDLSDVIESPDGSCYLMLVEGARRAHIKPLPEVRDEIEAALKAEETKRLRSKWIQRLRDKSFVVIYPIS